MATKVALSSLNAKIPWYPRFGKNNDHIKSLVEAIRAGAALPPILITSTRQIIDGMHTYHALKQEGAQNAMVEIVESEDELTYWELSVSRNCEHGLPLDLSERREFFAKMWQHLEMTRNTVGADRLAEAFHVSIDTIKRWMTMVEKPVPDHTVVRPPTRVRASREAVAPPKEEERRGRTPTIEVSKAEQSVDLLRRSLIFAADGDVSTADLVKALESLGDPHLALFLTECAAGWSKLEKAVNRFLS